MGKENSSPTKQLTLQVERINGEFRKLRYLENEIHITTKSASKTIGYKKKIYEIAEEILKSYSYFSISLQEFLNNIIKSTLNNCFVSCDFFDLSEFSELMQARSTEMNKEDFLIWKAQYSNELRYKLSRASALIVGDIIQVLNSETGFEFYLESICISEFHVSETYGISGCFKATINIK